MGSQAEFRHQRTTFRIGVSTSSQDEPVVFPEDSHLSQPKIILPENSLSEGELVGPKVIPKKSDPEVIPSENVKPEKAKAEKAKLAEKAADQVLP